MLEIKTISNRNKAEFDEEVNTALREGWELVRRDCLIVGADHSPVLYAELERLIDAPEVEDDGGEFEFATAKATWLLTRDPKSPYRCSECGHKTDRPDALCPVCLREMRLEFE